MTRGLFQIVQIKGPSTFMGVTLGPGPTIVKLLGLVIQDSPNFKRGDGSTTSRVEEWEWPHCKIRCDDTGLDAFMTEGRKWDM